jgi:hypothetical protein
MGNEELYDSIHSNSLPLIRCGDVAVDDYLLAPERDTRLGISLVIPIAIGEHSYRDLVGDFASVEPDQYYYPYGDLHVTVFDFVCAVADYTRSEADEAAFLRVAEETARTLPRFILRFEGIVFSESAGLICGYDFGALVDMRAALRVSMRGHGLPIDERYESRSAHATFCRFTKQPTNAEAFLDVVEKRRNFPFGKEFVDELVVVEHDWYNRRATRRTIGRVRLV